MPIQQDLGAALLAAAESGRTRAVEELLDAGASALAVDPMGRTALHKAAYLGLCDMANVMIKWEPSCVAACDIGVDDATSQYAPARGELLSVGPGQSFIFFSPNFISLFHQKQPKFHPNFIAFL